MVFEVLEFQIFVETPCDHWIGLGSWQLPEEQYVTWQFLIEKVSTTIHNAMAGFCDMTKRWKINITGERVEYRGIQAIEKRHKLWGMLWDDPRHIEWHLVEGEIWNLARRMSDGKK